MTEPVFMIIPHSAQNSERSTPTTRYSTMLHSFLSSSYGHYAEMFIKRIAEKAAAEFLPARRGNLRKTMREAATKFMLSDLEIVFLGYFCEKNEWDIHHPQIQVHRQEKNAIEEPADFDMRAFLEFNAYFVKSYLGTPEEFEEIRAFFIATEPGFLPCFQKWANSLPNERFQVSPRHINQIYSAYSRNCQSFSNRKDYNGLVDTIIELSTTYSIIPASRNGADDRRSVSQKEHPARNKDNKKSGFIQLEKKDEPNLVVPSNAESYNPFVSRYSRPDRNPEPSLIEYQRANNSSAIFEGLFAKSRRSALSRRSNLQQEEAERSREKKVNNNKICLKRFKNTERPNNTVIGCFTNPPAPPVEQKPTSKHYLREREGRSFLNNPSLGLFNMQSNISSRSFQLPPIPLKNNEEGFFFDKSRID